MKKFLFSIFTLILFLIPKETFADSEIIKNFNTTIIAHQDGSFSVTETIQYDFGDNRKHGIYRDIPKVTKVGDLYRISEIKVTTIKEDGIVGLAKIDTNSNPVSIRIGNPDVTVTGKHTYAISYLVKNGIGSNYSDHDEIYWNATGNEWGVPILYASASISTDFGVKPDKVICFTGPKGSKDQNCQNPTGNPLYPINTTKTLDKYSGLTIVASFPVNTFPRSVLSKNAPEDKTNTDLKLIGSILAVSTGALNLILAPSLLIWYLIFKRKKRFGKVGVNFDIPKDDRGTRIAPAKSDLAPALVGTIDNATLDQNDIVATIFDLAIRKYIKIEQIKKEKVLGIFGGGNDYLIRKLKNYDDLLTFEIILLDRLFKDGDIVEISSLKTDFYKTFNEIQEKVFALQVSKGYYSRNPKLQRHLLGAITIISAFLLQLILTFVLFLLYKKLIGRTAKGDLMDFKIDGLKLFLKNMAREFKWQAENLYTVEKYIPYAIALGYIDEFMHQLKILYPNYKPTWYSGNMGFYSATNSILGSFNSGITTANPSSSGFSGGSSGGGGGGGGGGSW